MFTVVARYTPSLDCMTATIFYKSVVFCSFSGEQAMDKADEVARLLNKDFASAKKLQELVS